MKRYLNLSIFILLSTFVCTLRGQTKVGSTCKSDEKDKASLYYYQGAIAGSQEDNRSAYYLYKYAHQLAPQDPAIAFALSLQYVQRQEPDKALPLLRQAYAADTTNRDVMRTYCTILSNISEKKSQAIAILERWVDNNPNDEEILQYLASLYYRASEYQKAIDLYGKIKQENKALFGEYLRLSMIRVRLFDYLNQRDKAIAEIDELIKAYPNEPYAKVSILKYFYNIEAYQEATRYLAMLEQDSSLSKSELLGLQISYYRGIADSVRWEQALRQELDDVLIAAESKLEHWQTYLRNKAVGDTLPESYNWAFERIVELHPDVSSVQLAFAKILKLQGQAPRATDLLFTLSRTTPEEQEVWTELMSLLVEQERYKELEVTTLKAMEHHPTEWRIVYLGTAAYIMQNKRTEGRRYLEQVLPRLEEAESEDYGLSVLYAMLGDLYEEDNRRRCYTYYDKALEYNESNADVLNNYAYFLALEGQDLPRAESMASRGLTVNKDNHNLLDTYAWILHLRGKNALAELYITKAIDEAGDELSGVHLDHYGDILQAQGKEADARSQWSKALSLYQQELSKAKSENASAKSRRELQAKIKRLQKLLKQK